MFPEGGIERLYWKLQNSNTMLRLSFSVHYVEYEQIVLDTFQELV